MPRATRSSPPSSSTTARARTRWSNDPELDTLIEKATAAGGDERAELWKQVFARANDTIITDIPMFHMVGFTRVSPRLDFQPTIATNSELQLSQVKFK